MLIILILTANIYTQYIRKTLFGEDRTLEHFDKSKLNISNEVSTTLFRADKLYEERNYKKAAAEYNSLLASNKLTNTKQQSMANYKMGMCNFKLRNYVAARDSFIRSIELDSSDAAAHNNTAICSYYLRDYEKALEHELKAINLKPTVEYYYNMGRIYETIEDYDNATKYYQGVIKGEEGITYDDLIDPVRIRNKVHNMVPDEKKRTELSKDVIIALKLNDMREILLIDDSDMDIKSFDFNLEIVKRGSGDRLVCSYDRDKLDPYHLIKSLTWTVKSGNRIISRNNNEDINLKIDRSLNYTVTLKIEYGSKTYIKTRQVNKNQVVAGGNNEEYKESSQADQVCKFYISAVYEQLFEKDMRISKKGYTDRFGVVWGKDDIETEIMDTDIVDAGSSLRMKNTTDSPSGIWADMSALIKNKSLEGRTVSVRFYSRKITENAVLKVRMRVKVGGAYKTTIRNYDLDYRWRRDGFDIKIPENTSGMTISLGIDPGQEAKIDGFTISIK